MPMTSVPIGLRSLHSRRHHRMVGHGAGIGQLDVGVVEMLPGHLDHQQRARRKGRQGLVIGGLPGVGDAGLDEDDQAGDDLAVQRQRMDAAHILLGKPVHGLAGEGGAVAVDRHGGALAALPAGRFQRQERLDGVADIFRAARDDDARAGPDRRGGASAGGTRDSDASAAMPSDTRRRRACFRGMAARPGRWSPAAGRASRRRCAAWPRPRRRAACRAAPDTLGSFRCGRDSIAKKSSITPSGSSRSTSGVPSGPNGLDQVRMIETPSGTAGFSTENGTSSRSRFLYSSPSRMTASRTSRSSRRGMAGARKRGLKNTLGSMVRAQR